MNPFDDPEGTFVVVTDDRGHVALWPTFAPSVEGWREIYGPAKRERCLTRVLELANEPSVAS